MSTVPPNHDGSGLLPAHINQAPFKHRIQNVHFENVFKELPGGNPVPTRYLRIPDGTHTGYPEHHWAGGRSNASAWVIRHADNVTFTNVTHAFLEYDARDEIVFAPYPEYRPTPIIHDRSIRHARQTRLQVTPGTQLYALNLPTEVGVIDKRYVTATLPITSWEPVNGFDPYTDGIYLFVGTLAMPQGFENPLSIAAVAVVTVGEADVDDVLSEFTTSPRDFISIRETARASRLWQISFLATETAPDGTTQQIPVNFTIPGPNANLSGTYTFGENHVLEGYVLVFDIRNNGANIVTFELRRIG